MKWVWLRGDERVERLDWCLGMYASGSTWAFNIVRTICAVAIPDQGVVSRFVGVASDIARPFAPAGLARAIIKSHETDAVAEAWLTANATSILITLRDPRDAVASV